MNPDNELPESCEVCGHELDADGHCPNAERAARVIARIFTDSLTTALDRAVGEAPEEGGR